MQTRTRREWLTAVALAVAMAVVMTWPLTAGFGTLGRAHSGDGQLSVWNVAWVARTLAVDPRRVFDANIFYPHRNALAFSETNLGSGVVAMPVYWATRNPIAAHNTATMLAFITASLGAYALARYLSGHHAAALVAAVLYAFCPHTFARFAHIQLLWTGALPLSLVACHRLIDRPTMPRAITLGATLGVSGLFCAYYAVFAGLSVGLAVLLYAFRRGLWRNVTYWLLVTLAAGVSFAIVLPFFLPYLALQEETGFRRQLGDADMFSANWSAWAASNAWPHRWLLASLRDWNDVLFPGVVLMTLGVAGLWYAFGSRAPQQSEAAPDHASPSAQRDAAVFYALLGAAAFWGSFGPKAGFYSALYYTVPIFDLLRAPSRFGIVLVLALTPLAAFALARWMNRSAQAARLAPAWVVLAGLELFQAPVDFRETPPFSRVYSDLARLPRGAVAEFPFFYNRPDFPRHAFYMLNSTVHWMPLVNGYSDLIPRDFRDMAIPVSSFPAVLPFNILREHATRYVIFHLNLYDRRSREKVLDRLRQYEDYLRPLSEDGDDRLYEIVGWP